ncbi:hypothetical protein PENSPDRAFT_689567 [Peniophora sp. CONT]|nr:hypothetical protein PENSPDRAFT_689567 [Peniophora sp. CONT]
MPRAIIESTPEDESTPEYRGGPTRTRGAVQDVESEEDMDVDAEGEDEDAEGELEDEQDDADAAYDVSDAAEDTPPPALARKGKKPAVRSGLKITLKPPAPQPQKSPRTRRTTRIIESPPEGSEPPPSRDVESEDEDAEGEEDEDEDDSEVMPGTSARQLTARQAALANAEETPLVSLESAPGRKKKQLNEVEEALKREETARKRKHMSEKRLEDEKMDTINRLLKKQSRPRNKRNALATADDRTPVSQTNAGTPDVEEEGSMSAPPRPVEVPTMYRWISTSRPAAMPIPEAGLPGAVIPASAVDEPPAHPAVEPVMVLSFSVPVNALPAANNAAPTAMDVDTPSRKMTPHCVAPGCQLTSKYRLKSNFLQGVCGIEHLKLLEQSTNA